ILQAYENGKLLGIMENLGFFGRISDRMRAPGDQYYASAPRKRSSAAPATLKTATTNFNRYREWESTVKGMGAEVEADGSGRFAAHINGDSIGEWDPKY